MSRDAITHEIGHAFLHGLRVQRFFEPHDLAVFEGFSDVFARIGKYTGDLAESTTAERGLLRFHEPGGDEEESSLDTRPLAGPGLIGHVSALTGNAHADGGLAVTIFNRLAAGLSGEASLAEGASRDAERTDGVNVSRAARLFGESLTLMGSQPPVRGTRRASWENWCYKTVDAAPTVGVDRDFVLATFLRSGIDCSGEEPKRLVAEGRGRGSFGCLPLLSHDLACGRPLIP